jgi:hypothetical protein
MIAPGAGIKAWAIVVYGHGTFIEEDEKMADIKARHFRDIGIHVTVIELGRVAAPPSKPKALLWNELTPGNYWAFPMQQAIIDSDPGALYAFVYGEAGRMYVELPNVGARQLDDSHAEYQFVRAVLVERDEVEFHPVCKTSGRAISTGEGGQ